MSIILYQVSYSAHYMSSVLYYIPSQHKWFKINQVAHNGRMFFYFQNLWRIQPNSSPFSDYYPLHEISQLVTICHKMSLKNVLSVFLRHFSYFSVIFPFFPPFHWHFYLSQSIGPIPNNTNPVMFVIDFLIMPIRRGMSYSFYTKL